MAKLAYLCQGIPLDPFPELKPLDQSIGHAPKRIHRLNDQQKKLAVRNALKYFPEKYHQQLHDEFKGELEQYGHIYMYRFIAKFPPVETLSVFDFPALNLQAACIMLQICNNLSYSIAQFPQELVTYGGNGQCFANWAQFYLTMQYLSKLELHETLVINSGLPLSVIPNSIPNDECSTNCYDVQQIWNDTQQAYKHGKEPKQQQTHTILQISNGMCIPNYSTLSHYNDYFALGVSSYGQMTAGSFCYIGPQGIVHGTTITLMSMAELYFPNYLSEFKQSTGSVDQQKSITVVDKASYPFTGKHIIHKDCIQSCNKSSTKLAPVYLTSGLGGMSGAQPKAGLIANTISITAEINFEPLIKRFNQGWLNEIITDIDTLIDRIRYVKKHNIVTSIGYHGNVVDIWEYLVKLYKTNKEVLVDLGSDQTSCHNITSGGYMPAGMNFDGGNKLLASNPDEFTKQIQSTLIRHINAINFLSEKTNLKFWDYGNAFLLESCKAGADIVLNEKRPEIINEMNLTSIDLKYQSYFQLIMDDIFSLGFGPFRWICHSNDEEDLKKSDQIATEVVQEELDLLKQQMKMMDPNKITKHLKDRRTQLSNNLTWIREADNHKLVVGCKARILYCDRRGRTKIALKFNEAIRNGHFKGPIVLSRDHHDVSSTDSPFRETSNISDGSKFTADMAVQNAIGLAARNATWISLHNGGGVGFGQVINGGFGLVLDGSKIMDNTIKVLMQWDVNNGITRRAWSGNDNALNTLIDEKSNDDRVKFTYRN